VGWCMKSVALLVTPRVELLRVRVFQAVINGWK
jgi:hypothetical protein